MPDFRREEQSASAEAKAKDDVGSGDDKPAQAERRRFPRSSTTIGEEQRQQIPALKPLLFSTRDLEPRAQFAAWQAYIAPLIDIRLPDNISTEAGFLAEHVAWNLGGILITQQSTPPHSYLRSQAKVKTNLVDHWHISVLHSGRTWTEVDGLVSEGEPGKVELRSLGHPFRGRSTEAKTLSLILPRTLLSDAPASTDVKNNVALSGTLTELLIE